MLTQEQAVEIRVLARRGLGVREIARQMDCSRNTVRRDLREAPAAKYKARTPRPTKLDSFKTSLGARIEAASPDWIPATVLLREIQQQGYTDGISQIKVHIAGLKPVTPVEPVVRFETAPGQQMQADFTIVRRCADPLPTWPFCAGCMRWPMRGCTPRLGRCRRSGFSRSRRSCWHPRS
mgnify:CR=1 FL=1